MLSRRGLLKLGVIAPAAYQLRGSDGFTSPRVTPFQVPLPIPAKLAACDLNTASGLATANAICDQAVREGRGCPPTVARPATKFCDLVAAPIMQQILPGQKTLVWGFGPTADTITYPGPTITANIGETVVMRVTNLLDNRLVGSAWPNTPGRIAPAPAGSSSPERRPT